MLHMTLYDTSVWDMRMKDTSSYKNKVDSMLENSICIKSKMKIT